MSNESPLSDYINTFYALILAINSALSLGYLGYHLAKAISTSLPQTEDEDSKQIFDIIFVMAITATFGILSGLSSYVVNKAFNHEFIANNLHSNEQDLEAEENHTITQAPPKWKQALLGGSYASEQAGDALSVSLAGTYWLNTFNKITLPIKLTSTLITLPFLVSYFPGLLPKLYEVSPNYTKNLITQKMAKHPVFFARTSALSEALYDVFSALTAIPASAILSLFELSPILVGCSLAALISFGLVIMSTENLLFEAKNLKDTLNIIRTNIEISNEQSNTIQLPHWKANVLKLSLYSSLALVSLMYTRPASAILALLDVNLEIHLALIALLTAGIAYCHYHVETKSILSEIQTIPDAKTLGQSIMSCIRSHTQQIEEIMPMLPESSNDLSINETSAFNKVNR